MNRDNQRAGSPTAAAPRQQPVSDDLDQPTAPVFVPESFLSDEPDDKPAAQTASAPPTVETGGVEPPTESADESTFTELIVGLDNDPADRPISSPAFNETGIVPLPQRTPASVDPEVTAARERAAAFWSTNGGENLESTDRHDEPQLHGPAEPEHDDDDDFTDIDSLFADPEPVERFAGGDAADPGATQRHEPVAAPQSQSPFAPGVAAGEAAPPFGGFAQQDAHHDSAGLPPIPADSGGAGGGNEKEQQRRGVRVILVAAAAALVVIGAVFGVTRLFGGGEGGQAAATASSTTAPATVRAPEIPTNKATEPPTETPTKQQPEFAPVAFQSESGNIRCQITPENGVACQILSPAFTPDEHQCDAGFKGAAVGLTKDGVNYPCLEHDLAGGQVLAYNEPISAGEYQCVIDYELGLSCNNAATDAFTMEFSAGISSSGNAAADKNPTVPVYTP